MKTIVFKIDGANVNCEIVIKDGFVTFPDVNYDYVWGMLHNNMLWASKDAKEWVLAFGVVIDGIRHSLQDLEQIEWVSPDET